MTTEPSAEDNSVIFWKGLGILTGFMLLICVIAWANDRHRLTHTSHGPEKGLAEIQSEYKTLLAEADNRTMEASKVNQEMAEALLAKESQVFELTAKLKSAEQANAKPKSPTIDPRIAEALESAQAELAAAKKAKEAAQSELAASLEAQEAVQRASGLARARIARLEEHRDSLLRRVDRLSTEQDELKVRISASTDMAQESDSEREEWRLKNAELQSQVANLSESVEKLKLERDVTQTLADARIQKAMEAAELQAKKMAENETRMEEMVAQNLTMKKFTRETEAKIIALMHKHADEIAQLKAHQASASVASSTATKTEGQAAPVTGDSMAELRILRAREESRSLEIRRLEQEVAALKAALQRSNN